MGDIFEIWRGTVQLWLLLVAVSATGYPAAGASSNKRALRTPLETDAAAPHRLEPEAVLAIFDGATLLRCQRCRGNRWRPNLAGDGEYCVRCTASSPLTTSPRDEG